MRGSGNRSEAVLFDRELFYALQPQGRLVEMIERFGDQFAERSAT